MKQTNRNSGFTLIELIIATAILGLVAMAVAGFMGAGARVYSSVNYLLRLQYESQLAMAQLQESVINCNSSIDFDGTSLAVVDSSGSAYTAQVFRFDDTDGCLYYGTETGTDPTAAVAAITADDLMARHMTGFSAALSDSAGAAQSITLTLNFERQGRTYTGTQTIALRNRPALG